MGGPEPDTSDLSAAERKELKELIDALEWTAGVAFGQGRRDETSSEASERADAVTAATETGSHLLARLRGALRRGCGSRPTRFSSGS